MRTPIPPTARAHLTLARSSTPAASIDPRRRETTSAFTLTTFRRRSQSEAVVGSGHVLPTEHDTQRASPERDLAVLMAERDQLAARAAALTMQLLEAETALSEVESLRIQKEALSVETITQRAELARLRDALAVARQATDVAYHQIDNLTRELDATHRTVSWRLTAALRATRRRRRARRSK